MIIEVKKATPGDVFYIMYNLSKPHRAELEQHKKSIRERRAFILDQMKDAELDVAYLDGKPAAMFGVELTTEKAGDKNLAWTWYVCTDAFIEVGARGAVFCRKYLRYFIDNNPDFQVVSAITDPRPSIDKWIEMIGGTFIVENSGIKIFSYS